MCAAAAVLAKAIALATVRRSRKTGGGPKGPRRALHAHPWRALASDLNAVEVPLNLGLSGRGNAVHFLFRPIPLAGAGLIPRNPLALRGGRAGL